MFVFIVFFHFCYSSFLLEKTIFCVRYCIENGLKNKKTYEKKTTTDFYWIEINDTSILRMDEILIYCRWLAMKIILYSLFYLWVNFCEVSIVFLIKIKKSFLVSLYRRAMMRSQFHVSGIWYLFSLRIEISSSRFETRQNVWSMKKKQKHIFFIKKINALQRLLTTE